MSVIVLSQNYASSERCMDELVMILEQKRNFGHIVLPVFFDVDPSDVRKQKGCFGEDNFMIVNGESHKLRDWRNALKEVADFGGMPLQNQADGHEAMFIENIIEVVINKLRPRALNNAPNLIGIDHRAIDIILWLQDISTNIGIYVISGIGGIGKTTLAKFVYNSYARSFEGSSFLANIREIAKQCNGLVRLQKQLLYDIVGKKERVSNVDEGIMMIEDALSCKTILLVLDDVDEVDQISKILGMRNWHNPAIKIIITTRHESLLKPSTPHKVHKVEVLNEFDALNLFSWHAFGEDHPFEGYLELSKKVLLHCAGLPLALRVLGSTLSGRSLEVWRSALEKLETIPEGHVIQKLKLSFDSLEDNHDKNIFLHIAFFFLDMNRDDTVKILDGCGFHTIIGIQNLIDKSLLTVNDLNKLEMHQLLQDLGRDIVRRESGNPGNRSRLWNNKNSFRVLRDKNGTERIEGIILDMPMLMEDKSAKRCFASNSSRKRFFKECAEMSDGSFPEKFNGPPLLQNLDLSENSISCLPEWVKSLPRLQNLSVQSCKMLKSLTEIPSCISELYIEGCSSLERMTYQSILPNYKLGSDDECGSLVLIQGEFKLEALVDHRYLDVLVWMWKE